MGNVSKASSNKFEWLEETCQFNEDFIKNYSEESDKGYFLDVGVQYPEKLYELRSDLTIFIRMKEN